MPLRSFDNNHHFMAYVLGWKDILRPIRDGYHHLFPPPDSGPMPEERRKQRERDRLKGFTYFDTFEQLENWTKLSSDPLQRANTPLIQRSGDDDIDGGKRTNVSLCHDYSGNYHDYEATQGTWVDEELYSCEYLQFIDAFIYFSHKLVCVPPPTWTNTLHRNGIKSLGTVLIEPQTKNSKKLLHHEQTDGSTSSFYFPLARKLAAIAIHYGFDGWLMNIEKSFAGNNWDSKLLVAFLEQLKVDMGNQRRLIWYDALTTDNKVAYQNALTPSNMPFSKACGSILTNYCWKESNAVASKRLGARHSFSTQHILFGIDVWAQNPSALTHPRITYPEHGGGGTNTGIAIRKLAELGLSACIFAPGWSFEHFPGRGSEVERAVWYGHDLPIDLDCSCGNVQTCHPSNRACPVALHAKKFSSGSRGFFYTNFTRAFRHHGKQEQNSLYNVKRVYAQLGAQSILPQMPRTINRVGQAQDNAITLTPKLEDVDGRAQLVIEMHIGVPDKHATDDIRECWLPLFTLDMPADGSLRFEIVLKSLLAISDATARIYLKSKGGHKFLSLKAPGGTFTLQTAVENESRQITSDRLKEIGLYVRAPAKEYMREQILEIYEIRITNHAISELVHCCHIDSIQAVNRHNEGEEHWRLRWTYRDMEARSAWVGMPYSDITGPFSHFLVRIDGRQIGRSYALEYVLSGEVVDCISGREVEVLIAGVGFDGRQLAGSKAKIHVCD